MMTLLNGKENTLLRFLAFDNVAVDERKKLIDLASTWVSYFKSIKWLSGSHKTGGLEIVLCLWIQIGSHPLRAKLC